MASGHEIRAQKFSQHRATLVWGLAAGPHYQENEPMLSLRHCGEPQPSNLLRKFRAQNLLAREKVGLADWLIPREVCWSKSGITYRFPPCSRAIDVQTKKIFNANARIIVINEPRVPCE